MRDTSRFLGGLLCAAIVAVALIFLWGVSARSYWALAIPVAVGFLGILAMGFWIGWTILTIRTAPPTAEPPSPSPPTSGENLAPSEPLTADKKLKD